MINSTNEIKISADAWFFMSYVAGLFGFGWWPFLIILVVAIFYMAGSHEIVKKKAKKNE